MGTKKGRICGKGAPFKGAPQRLGGSCPTLPPPWIRHWITVSRRNFDHNLPGDRARESTNCTRCEISCNFR